MNSESQSSKLDCTIVDVFAEKPLAGNQLAVVRGCAHLDAATMQDIAREMNFSETTFVVEERSGESTVRIFTTERELPFAGHPTLGTAWVLGRADGSYVLDLPAGRVPVSFDDDGIAWMDPPPVEFGDGIDLPAAAALLGLDEDDIDPEFPCRLATIGPSFVLIGLKTLDGLRRVRVNADLHEEISQGKFLNPFIFSREAYSSDADFSARMLMVRSGREDPATGSANSAFAAYLRTLGRDGRVVVEQGFEIGRPSRLYLEVEDRLRVGGRVRRVLTGSLEV